MFCKISWLGSGFNTSSGTYTETHADKMTKLAHTCIYNSTYLSHIVFSLSLYLYLSHYILLGLFVVCIILCSFSKQKLYILPPWTKAGMIGGDIGGRLLIWRHRRFKNVETTCLPSRLSARDVISIRALLCVRRSCPLGWTGHYVRQ